MLLNYNYDNKFLNFLSKIKSVKPKIANIHNSKDPSTVKLIFSYSHVSNYHCKNSVNIILCMK